MTRTFKSILAALVSALLLSICLFPLFGQQAGTPSPSRPQPRSGDIVFQDSEVDEKGNKHSGQARPIKELTRSDWSHMGIYFERPGGAVVVEAIGKAHKEIPWKAWLGHGADGKFAVRRLKGGLDRTKIDASIAPN